MHASTAGPLLSCLVSAHADERTLVLSCRSPTVVIAYLMKLRGWRLAESYKWVKDKRPNIKISEGAWRCWAQPACAGGRLHAYVSTVHRGQQAQAVS